MSFLYLVLEISFKDMATNKLKSLLKISFCVLKYDCPAPGNISTWIPRSRSRAPEWQPLGHHRPVYVFYEGTLHLWGLSSFRRAWTVRLARLTDKPNTQSVVNKLKGNKMLQRQKTSLKTVFNLALRA